MIRTKINREVNKQIVMLRLDQLASQLPPKNNMVAVCRQTGKKSRIIRVQLLIWGIQLAHQQLNNLINNQ